MRMPNGRVESPVSGSSLPSVRLLCRETRRQLPTRCARTEVPDVVASCAAATGASASGKPSANSRASVYLIPRKAQYRSGVQKFVHFDRPLIGH